MNRYLNDNLIKRNNYFGNSYINYVDYVKSKKYKFNKLVIYMANLNIDKNNNINKLHDIREEINMLKEKEVLNVKDPNKFIIKKKLIEERIKTLEKEKDNLKKIIKEQNETQIINVSATIEAEIKRLQMESEKNIGKAEEISQYIIELNKKVKNLSDQLIMVKTELDLASKKDFYLSKQKIKELRQLEKKLTEEHDNAISNVRSNVKELKQLKVNITDEFTESLEDLKTKSIDKKAFEQQMEGFLNNYVSQMSGIISSSEPVYRTTTVANEYIVEEVKRIVIEKLKTTEDKKNDIIKTSIETNNLQAKNDSLSVTQTNTVQPEKIILVANTELTIIERENLKNKVKQEIQTMTLNELNAIYLCFYESDIHKGDQFYKYSDDEQIYTQKELKDLKKIYKTQNLIYEEGTNNKTKLKFMKYQIDQALKNKQRNNVVEKNIKNIYNILDSKSKREEEKKQSKILLEQTNNPVILSEQTKEPVILSEQTTGQGLRRKINKPKKTLTKKQEQEIINYIKKKYKLKGGSFFEDVGHYVKNVYSALTEGVRIDYPPAVREFLKDNGDKIIINIKICKQPIQKTISNLLNVISLGQIEQAKKQHSYDDLMHLFMIATTNNGTKIIIEKNQVINIGKYNGDPYQASVEINTDIALNDLLNNAKNSISAEDYFLYDSVFKNCQGYLIDLLSHSGLLTPALESFIVQDTKDIIGNLNPYTKSFMQGAVKISQLYDIIIHGRALKRHKK